MNFLKKSLPFVIILLLLIVIKNNVTDILASFNNTNTTSNLTQLLSSAKKENRYLKEQLKYVKTDQFVGEEAQTKLGLLKPGEYFVIAPTPAPLASQNVNIDQTPNWQKWLELFF